MLVWRVVKGLPWRNAGLPPERRIEFRVGIHLGDVVEESDGDLYSWNSQNVPMFKLVNASKGVTSDIQP